MRINLSELGQHISFTSHEVQSIQKETSRLLEEHLCEWGSLFEKCINAVELQGNEMARPYIDSLAEDMRKTAQELQDLAGVMNQRLLSTAQELHLLISADDMIKYL